ncbi:MAG: hypothetical protein ACO3NK_15235 [Prochlorotrichaceae cyanobacterium]|jgi:hypothetical protein
MELTDGTETLQYITNAQGDRVGVVVPWETYTQLFPASPDPDYIPGLSHQELQALAQCKLASDEQQRLDDLLNRQNQNLLSAEELQHLDQLLLQIDNLTLLKTRARYTLQALTQSSGA